MAAGDTRRISAFGSYYRETEKSTKYKKELKDTEDMCLLTEVRDNYYSYEGFNMIAGCSNVADWWARAEEGRVKADYKGPKVSLSSLETKGFSKLSHTNFLKIHF